MKLCRFGQPNQEKPGLIDEQGQIRDVSHIISDFDAENLTIERLTRLSGVDINQLPVIDDGTRLGSCVTNVDKVICIGRNYAEHAKETGSAIPTEPVVFTKFSSCLIGPNDDVVIPKTAAKTDWEVELALVIGKKARYIPEENALSYVAGYCVMNDVSERQWQLEGTGQWIKGKACDGFAPLGPYLVTADEVADPQNLNLWLEVDGERYQQANTRDMIFSIAHIISYLSSFFTLLPGDIIATGTPPGVGLGQKPEPIFLKPGQAMRLSVEGLGEQSCKTVLEND